MRRQITEEKSQENKILAVEVLDPTEASILEELGSLFDLPDKRQKQLLEDLVRLHHSLHGPEGLLDRGNYSRPFPPPPQNQQSNLTRRGS